MPAGQFVALALVAAFVAGCSASSSGLADAGGSPTGSISSSSGDAGPPAPSAAVASLGNRLGASLDNEDKTRAYAALIQALDTGPSGAPVAWRNPDSGRYGSVVPGPAYQENGATCRAYTHTVFIDGKPQFRRGTACRNAAGAWAIVD